jgi:hypothetical protein
LHLNLALDPRLSRGKPARAQNPNLGRRRRRSWTTSEEEEAWWALSASAEAAWRAPLASAVAAAEGATWSNAEEATFEHKLLYFDLKENPRGRYLKVSEKTSTTRSTINVPIANVAWFLDLFEYYIRTDERDVLSKELRLDTKVGPAFLHRGAEFADFAPLFVAFYSR